MSTVRQLAEYFTHKVLLGYGGANVQVGGFDVVVPKVQDQMSADGENVLLATRQRATKEKKK